LDAIEQKLKALDGFKDWSNYLLVTTVAALGWTAEKGSDSFCTPWIKQVVVLLFALSVVFAILTLALIPHVAEDIKTRKNGQVPSIYHVYWKGWFVELRLTRLCFPQHVFFLLGIILYATATAFPPARCVSCLNWFIGMAAGSLCLLFVLGHLPRAKEPPVEPGT
jgi:hypothetical protein